MGHAFSLLAILHDCNKGQGGYSVFMIFFSYCTSSESIIDQEWINFKLSKRYIIQTEL